MSPGWSDSVSGMFLSSLTWRCGRPRPHTAFQDRQNHSPEQIQTRGRCEDTGEPLPPHPIPHTGKSHFEERWAGFFQNPPRAGSLAASFSAAITNQIAADIATTMAGMGNMVNRTMARTRNTSSNHVGNFITASRACARQAAWLGRESDSFSYYS